MLYVIEHLRRQGNPSEVIKLAFLFCLLALLICHGMLVRIVATNLMSLI